jgi:hypothetical protein
MMTTQETEMTSKLIAVLTFMSLILIKTAFADLSGLLHKLTGTGEPAKTVMVLVDVSASINPEDKSLYETSFQSALQFLEPGDRLMLATIGDQGRANFRLGADVTIPKTGIRLDDEEKGKTARDGLQAAFHKILDDKRGKEGKVTYLLDAITASAEALQPKSEANSYYLMVYSDMVEESKAFNFVKTRPSIKFLDSIKKANLLPPLPGVNVFVCGASGKYYAETQAFWEAYFKASGALLKSYGRLAVKNL